MNNNELDDLSENQTPKYMSIDKNTGGFFELNDDFLIKLEPLHLLIIIANVKQDEMAIVSSNINASWQYLANFIKPFLFQKDENEETDFKAQIIHTSAHEDVTEFIQGITDLGIALKVYREETTSMIVITGRTIATLPNATQNPPEILPEYPPHFLDEHRSYVHDRKFIDVHSLKLAAKQIIAPDNSPLFSKFLHNINNGYLLRPYWDPCDTAKRDLLSLAIYTGYEAKNEGRDTELYKFLVTLFNCNQNPVSHMLPVEDACIVTDFKGYTPLHYACAQLNKGQTADAFKLKLMIVFMLLLGGRDLPNDKGWHALETLKDQDFRDICDKFVTTRQECPPELLQRVGNILIVTLLELAFDYENHPHPMDGLLNHALERVINAAQKRYYWPLTRRSADEFALADSDPTHQNVGVEMPDDNVLIYLYPTDDSPRYVISCEMKLAGNIPFLYKKLESLCPVAKADPSKYRCFIISWRHKHAQIQHYKPSMLQVLQKFAAYGTNEEVEKTHPGLLIVNIKNHEILYKELENFEPFSLPQEDQLTQDNLEFIDTWLAPRSYYQSLNEFRAVFHKKPWQQTTQQVLNELGNGTYPKLLPFWNVQERLNFYLLKLGMLGANADLVCLIKELFHGQCNPVTIMPNDGLTPLHYVCDHLQTALHFREPRLIDTEKTIFKLRAAIVLLLLIGRRDLPDSHGKTALSYLPPDDEGFKEACVDFVQGHTYALATRPQYLFGMSNDTVHEFMFYILNEWAVYEATNKNPTSMLLEYLDRASLAGLGQTFPEPSDDEEEIANICSVEAGRVTPVMRM